MKTPQQVPNEREALRSGNVLDTQKGHAAVIVEINGDSMEPYYPHSTLICCKKVDSKNWPFLSSGVYVVGCSDFFVVRRVKVGPANGKITLHSDNPDTGSSIEVALSELREVWKVWRIMDAPAR